MVKVHDAALTDDVVEFMAGWLQKLAEETENVLNLAACIGNQFDLETDENLRRIRFTGRKKWKRESSYHRRSLSVCAAFRRKTTMFRLKVTFGGKLRGRKFDA
ncbi:MAG: hypothetical protein QNJ68_13000 [Microcoleaceae cyanobacterium MO_207.B10]|nr:hypothetical protein [Microcoleaceae cyanobacterium MO_207.B10]